MTEIKELIRALRCSITVPTSFNASNCFHCKYAILERIPSELSLAGAKADIVVDGVSYWTRCDFDAMIGDAIRILENMEKQPE